MNQSTPYISFVMIGRNDTYGGNFLNRVQNSVSTLAYLARKHNLDAELVIVEYNPLPDRERFADALRPLVGSLHTRIISIPQAFHERISNGSKIPVLEYIAKNIGTRRARGSFIACTNPDILFSDAFIAWLASKPLRKDMFYRANRSDLDVPEFALTTNRDTILAEAKQHTVRRWYSTGSEYISWKRWLKRFIKRPFPRKFFQSPLFNPLRALGRKKNNALHEGAAGDFLLTHRDNWEAVSGYDERRTISFTDGYILYTLHCKGLTQYVIPYDMYHIFHPLASSGRPITDLEQYEHDKQRMLKTNIPYIEPNPDWGYPKESFSEEAITAS